MKLTQRLTVALALTALVSVPAFGAEVYVDPTEVLWAAKSGNTMVLTVTGPGTEFSQTFENGDAQLEFVDAVLSLEVTPHITSDSSIIMEIEVSRNAPDDSVFTLTGSPAIAKNQVQTETLVKDGQTLVLGGIYVVDKSDRESRTPYLHKIPFIGNAFKSSEYRDSRNELLIFVTPRVVATADAAS